MSKLREKLDSIIPKYDSCSDNDIDYLERSIDDFAVKFAEFQIGLLTNEIDNVFYFDYDAEWITTTELLQIFKDKYYE